MPSVKASMYILTKMVKLICTTNLSYPVSDIAYKTAKVLEEIGK